MPCHVCRLKIRLVSDYLNFLAGGRAWWQRLWETEVGTTVQNDFKTVTKNYVVDYLSLAFRDILVTEDGSFTQRYVYDVFGTRISAEYSYADGTERGTTNANGERGENLQSDFAVNEVGKLWFRTSMLGSTLEYNPLKYGAHMNTAIAEAMVSCGGFGGGGGAGGGGLGGGRH